MDAADPHISEPAIFDFDDMRAVHSVKQLWIIRTVQF